MDEAASVPDWKGLLARCHQWSRDRAAWEQSNGQPLSPEWLPTAFAPATEGQIACEEARLGVRLPPSLRSFYLQTNGHGRVGNFILAVRSVEQIGWMRDAVPFLHDILFEVEPVVARCLVVSGEADASWWLLDPSDVDDHGEWRAGRWSSWHPGMRWVAADFFGLFEDEVSTAQRLLAIDQCPPPPQGTQ